MSPAVHAHAGPPPHRPGRVRPTPLPGDAAGGLDALSAALVAQAPLRTLLIRTALLAEAHGLAEDADVICALVLRLGVSQPLFSVARALALLGRGDAAAALRTVERDVLADDPSHELGCAVRVCAWRCLGRADWRVHANALLAQTREPKVRQLVAQAS